MTRVEEQARSGRRHRGGERGQQVDRGHAPRAGEGEQTFLRLAAPVRVGELEAIGRDRDQQRNAVATGERVDRLDLRERRHPGALERLAERVARGDALRQRRVGPRVAHQPSDQPGDRPARGHAEEHTGTAELGHGGVALDDVVQAELQQHQVWTQTQSASLE